MQLVLLSWEHEANTLWVLTIASLLHCRISNLNLRWFGKVQTWGHHVDRYLAILWWAGLWTPNKYHKPCCEKLSAANGKNDNEYCPLCEAEEVARKSFFEDKIKNKSDGDLANRLRTSKFYPIKVLDRKKPSDGVKFWLIKDDSYKNQGDLDKLFILIEKYGELSDIEKGYDIELNLTKNQKNRLVVTSILPERVSVLSEDKKTLENILNEVESLSWRQVFLKKTIIVYFCIFF